MNKGVDESEDFLMSLKMFCERLVVIERQRHANGSLTSTTPGMFS